MSRVSEKANCDINDINNLYSIINNPDSPHQMIVRAKIILRSNEGKQNKDIAEELNTNANLVGNWIKRFRESGLQGLYDLHRRGRSGGKSSEDVYAEITERLANPMPTGDGQWTAAALADDIGVSKDKIWSTLRSHGIELDRKRSWEIETGKSVLSRKVDVAGLFISSTEKAIVLSFAPGEQSMEGDGILSTKNRELAAELEGRMEGGGTLSLEEILRITAGHAADGKRFAHTTLVSYMNRLVEKIDDDGVSYTVVFSGNAYVPTKSLRKSSIMFHRTADDEEWLRTADFIMSRFCMPSEYLPVMEALRLFVDSREESSEDFVWINHASTVSAETVRQAQSLPPGQDSGSQAEAGLTFTATYVSESGERRATSVRISGEDLPSYDPSKSGKDELLRYVGELTASVRPAIDRLGEDSCNMLANGNKKN